MKKFSIILGIFVLSLFAFASCGPLPELEEEIWTVTNFAPYEFTVTVSNGTVIDEGQYKGKNKFVLPKAENATPAEGGSVSISHKGPLKAGHLTLTPKDSSWKDIKDDIEFEAGAAGNAIEIRYNPNDIEPNIKEFDDE